MTIEEATDILKNVNWEEFIQYHTPIGMEPKEILSEVLQWAQGYDLEQIVKGHLGLEREMFGDSFINTWFESDIDLRNRALELLNGISKKSCQHNFTTYYGFTTTYEYCTICDEKKTKNNEN